MQDFMPGTDKAAKIEMLIQQIAVANDDGDGTKAAEWFQAAEQGNGNAQYELGLLYREGRGVPKDYVKAAEWFRKAAEQGNGSAQYELSILYQKGRGVPKDDAKAAEWFIKAIESLERSIAASEAWNAAGAMAWERAGIVA